jgi:hypothetical protein
MAGAIVSRGRSRPAALHHPRSADDEGGDHQRNRKLIGMDVGAVRDVQEENHGLRDVQI